MAGETLLLTRRIFALFWCKYHFGAHLFGAFMRPIKNDKSYYYQFVIGVIGGVFYAILSSKLTTKTANLNSKTA